MPYRCSLFSAVKICRGRYFDGFLSRPCDVSVRLTSKNLTILFEDGRQQEWLAGRIVKIHEASIALAYGNQRLSVDCGLSQLPRAFLISGQTQRSVWTTVGLVGGLLIWLFAVVDAVLPWSIAYLSRNLSPKFEYVDAYERFERLVERVPGYKTRGASFCIDSAGSAVLSRLAAALTARVKLKWKPEIVVMRNHDDQAVALGAGLVVMTSGFLLEVGSQAEFSAILAHEIGHNELESQSLNLVEVSSLLGLADILFNSTIGRWSALLVGRGNYIPPSARQREREADQYAVERLREAGLDPGVYAESMRRRGDRDVGIFDTHPPRSERARMFQAAAQPGSSILTEQDWRALKSICRTTTKTAPVSPPEPS